MSVAMELPGMRSRMFLNNIPVIGLGIAAPHILQHLIIPGLDRDLDVGHDFGKFGDRLHDIFAEIIRVRGKEADAFQTVHLVQHSQQGRQVGASGLVLPVPVNDLAKQGDLLNALRHQGAHFGQHIRQPDGRVRRRAGRG